MQDSPPEKRLACIVVWFGLENPELFEDGGRDGYHRRDREYSK